MAAPKKLYTDVDAYEKKLEKVMKRLGVNEYEFDYGRRDAWVNFKYKGEQYHFEHGIENAEKQGINLYYGSDAFAQIVLALEDLARIANRGIYDLQNWIAGMKLLPAAVTLPLFCSLLGLDHLPVSEDEIQKAYKDMAKIRHPDIGGSEEDFKKLTQAKQEALDYLANGGSL